jgi:hypothetical protein
VVLDDQGEAKPGTQVVKNMLDAFGGVLVRLIVPSPTQFVQWPGADELGLLRPQLTDEGGPVPGLT